VHFWAGNISRGILALFDSLDKGKLRWSLRSVIGVMVRADVSADARRQIFEQLRGYFQNPTSFLINDIHYETAKPSNVLAQA